MFSFYKFVIIQYMNPTAVQQQAQNSRNHIESSNEWEKPEVINDSISHSDQDKKKISESWADFYQLRTSEIQAISNETRVNRVELQNFQVENSPSENRHSVTLESKENYVSSSSVAEKSNGSVFAEAGLKLDFPGLGKEIFKGIFGAFSLFKEIFSDTVNLISGKKDKKAEHAETDPAKAKAAAEKKAKEQKRKGNIRAFYDGLRAQTSPVVSVEAVQAETQERANINKTVKLNESYKGIKNSFGRLTVYAASIFEREQLDQEKKYKKQEKEMKIASVKGPDLGLDKAAEGGFLSSTGGQGAG